MPLSTIYIARHGYRSNWLPKPHPEPPTGIDSDHVLAPLGLKQAEELADYVASLDEKPQLIFSSPFYRCLQTSTPLSRRLDLDILVENGIGEMYKPDRPVIPAPATLDHLKKFFDNLNENWQSVLTPSSNGETEDDIFKRTKKFWELFLPLVNEKFPNVKSIILVCHAASKIALGMSLMGYNSVRDTIDFQGEPYIKSGSCSLDKYVFNSESNKWEIKINGKTDFLSKGELMNWHFIYQVEAGSDEDIERRRKKAEAEGKPDPELEAAKEDPDQIEDFYVTLEVPVMDLKTVFQKSSSPGVAHPAQAHLAFNYQAKPKDYGERYNSTNRASYYKNVFRTPNQSLLDASSTIHSSYKPTSKIQMTGLESSTPFVKIDDAFFQGEWKPLVGTEIVLDENGEVVGKVNNHIQLTQGNLVPKSQIDKEKQKKRSLNDVKVSKTTSTYETAIALAKRRLANDTLDAEKNGKAPIETPENDGDINMSVA